MSNIKKIMRDFSRFCCKFEKFGTVHPNKYLMSRVKKYPKKFEFAQNEPQKTDNIILHFFVLILNPINVNL